jgi:hypothetical protein
MNKFTNESRTSSLNGAQQIPKWRTKGSKKYHSDSDSSSDEPLIKKVQPLREPGRSRKASKAEPVPMIVSDITPNDTAADNSSQDASETEIGQEKKTTSPTVAAPTTSPTNPAGNGMVALPQLQQMSPEQQQQMIMMYYAQMAAFQQIQAMTPPATSTLKRKKKPKKKEITEEPEEL